MKFVILSILLFVVSFNLFGSKYAKEIFRVGSSVKNTAIGHCGLTDKDGRAWAVWNPALIDFGEKNKIEIMHSEDFGGLLKTDVISYTSQNKISFTLVRIGSYDNPLTELPNSEQDVDDGNKPFVSKMFSTSDYILYGGVPFNFGKINMGITAKLIHRDLYEATAYGFGADLGIYYEINKFVMLGGNVRDFFSTQLIWNNDTYETIPPALDAEVKLSFPFPFLNVPAHLFAGFDGYSESRDSSAIINAGVFSFDPRFGLEILLHKNISVYGGYSYENFNSGMSVFIKNWSANYAFETAPILDTTHKISLGFDFE